MIGEVDFVEVRDVIRKGFKKVVLDLHMQQVLPRKKKFMLSTHLVLIKTT